MIHPSLIQKISLDERQATSEIVDELKRSYPYVGPIMVSQHAATEPACNTMRMIVRMSKPYWLSTDPDGDAMWAEVSSWLKGKLYKVGSTMVNYNKTHAEHDMPLVSFGRLELEMKSVLLALALPEGDELPDVETQVARYREILNAGTFGEQVVERVEMPGAASLAAQRAAAAPAEQAEGEDASEEAVAAELDYRLWDIVFADGSVRTLDSVAGTWC